MSVISPKAMPKVVPKVVIDARMIGPIGHGIARYVSDLAWGLLHLRSERGLAYAPVFLVSRECPADALPGDFPRRACASPFLHPKEWFEIPRVLREERPALFHSPSFAAFFSSPLLPRRLHLPCPTVVTIHDLNHLTFGDFPRRLYYQWLLKPFARRARALTTVSEFSRQEIMRWLGCGHSRVRVIPNAVGRASAAGAGDLTPAAINVGLLKQLGLKTGEYFLCLANTKPHKNIALLLRAYARYREQAGPDAWPLAVTARLAEGTAGVVPCVGLSNAEVDSLLAASGALVSPSVYEGFGRPPLEALVAGVPVILSDIPPHREIGRAIPSHRLHYVPAQDEAAWANALHLAQHGKIGPSPENVIRQAIDQFSVRRQAEATDALYVQCLQATTDLC